MADDELISEYKLTLSELVTNAKITINVLSMLADENKKFAPQIAETIEERIRTAIPSQKLPALYLIDSIIKNVKDSDYLKIFTKNIVSLFICVFERGDEKIRSAMYKLRQTWVDLFPNDILLKLDLAVSSIDPAWPITAIRPVVGQQTVHLNPDFLNKAKEALKGLTNANSLKIARPSEADKLGGDRKEDQALAEPEVSLGNVPISSGSGTVALGSEPEILLQKQLMAKQLLAKQQELLQIQQRRVEIELAKAQLQIEQAKQLALQKPKQSQEVSLTVANASEDESSKKSKVKRDRNPSKGEDAEGLRSSEKVPEEPSATSPLKNKVSEPIKSILNADSHRVFVPGEIVLENSAVEKPPIRKRKSGDVQKIDPRLRKKMMLNKDGLSTSAKDMQGDNNEKQKETERVKTMETIEEAKKIVKETKLSEDLKDLFGNEDKDFRMQMPLVSKVPDTQWKVLKSEGKNIPTYNFTQNKFAGGERRVGIHNKFGPYARHGNRKALLPTPAPIFGQDLKPRQTTLENFEKLQAMKKELDVEAERLNSLNYDVSKNADLEAFEADVMRGNSLLNKARWNNWRQQERLAKRLRRQSGDQFHNGPPFGNRPHPRSLLHAPPRANFPDIQPHRPSPPHQQYNRQPSPPQFIQQPRSPGQGNFDRGHENYDCYGGDVGNRHGMDLHYHDENRRSPSGNSWGGYQVPNPHNPTMRTSNPSDWHCPSQAFSQSCANSITTVPKSSLDATLHSLNNFSSHNKNHSAVPPSSQTSDQQYVSQLFSKLTQFGILSNIITSASKEQEEIPSMSNFDLKKMKIKYKSLVDNLNSGTLCRTCGLTFPPTRGIEKKKGEEQAKARYLMHLDWHFQVNRKANSIPKAERCREYYADPDNWYVHEVVNVTRITIDEGKDSDGKIEDLVSSTKPKSLDAFEERMELMKEKHKDDLNTFVYKNDVKQEESCFICNEGFESYWDDEKEEWGLKDAYKLKEKLFHSICFLEYDENEASFVGQHSSVSQSCSLNDTSNATTEDEIREDSGRVNSPVLLSDKAKVEIDSSVEAQQGSDEIGKNMHTEQNSEYNIISEQTV